MKDLEKKLKTGVSVGFYTKILTQASQFIFGIILARLLSPEDYGLAGMLAFFIAFYEMLVDSGFGVAIIQKKEPSDDDYNTVFWFNMVISLILYVILYVSSPYIAEFYNDDRLIIISRVLGLVPIINAFGSIQGKYLNKNLKFKSLAKISYIALVSGSIFATILAFAGFGVWSLIYKSIFFAVVLNSGFWIISKWKPKWIFSVNSFKQLFKFGSKIMLNSFFEVIFKNIYSLIIGKYFNPQTLGIYTRAKQFNDMPDDTVRISTVQALFPSLSHIQDDNKKLIDVYKKALSLMAFVLFPLYAILACSAYPMIEVLLTDKWIESAGYLQLMCIMAVTLPFETVNGNVLYVKGKSNYILTITIIERVVFVCLIFALIPFGLKGLVYVLIIDAFLKVILYAYFSRKVINYGIVQQIKDVSVIILLAVVSLLVMFPLNYLIENTMIKLILIIVSGAGIYISLSFILKLKQIQEVINLIKFRS